MESKNKKVEDIFKQEGLKKTQGRNAVLDILTASDKPLTYDEVFLALINKNISVNVSTVYRILETFVDKGIVSKLNGGENNRSLYELARSEHRHYFFCVSCREMYPINICPLGSLVEDLKTKQFEVFDHKLEVSGVCSECRECREH
jgi:Fur family ferric uptake transcriptional regulator